MASLVDSLNLNHLSTGFAGADFLSPIQPPGLAYASACQGGRRSDVMVHRVLKFLFFVLFWLVLFASHSCFFLFIYFLCFFRLLLEELSSAFIARTR